jgi:translation initiation factor IF-3
MALKEKRGPEPRVNREITADKIRLIGADGEMVGVTNVAEGLRVATAAGLDLVEISPHAEPPVCKVMDYGKFRFAEQKKLQEQRKKQKVIQIKEIKVRPGIGQHDLEIKLRAIHKFLDDGDKVKLTLRFRGREMAHQELGMAVLNKVREQLGDKIKVEHEPKMEGRQVMMVVAPSGKH